MTNEKSLDKTTRELLEDAAKELEEERERKEREERRADTKYGPQITRDSNDE